MYMSMDDMSMPIHLPLSAVSGRTCHGLVLKQIVLTYKQFKHPSPNQLRGETILEGELHMGLQFLKGIYENDTCDRI